MSDARAFARDAWRLLEPLHAVVYFSPEPLAALREAGFKGFWMGYFAGRAAPLGAVGPELVHALFFNFTPERVARALPAAWEFAGPEAALHARSGGAVAALRRQLGALGTAPATERAADLAARAAASADTAGRGLAAVNRALPVPDEPLARLWWAATVLREHRGDGHVAALLGAGVTGRESHVLHAASNGTGREVYAAARDFDADEWASRTESLRRKGLLGADGLTERGARIKADIEERTDALAAGAYAALSQDERHELLALLRPLAAAVAGSGDIPLDSPMGLDLREVAHDAGD